MAKVILEQGKGPLPILAAYPVVMVGSVVDGKPDFATVAWTGVSASNPPTISVALQHHRHSLKGIRQHLTFSVNIPSVDLVRETDHCGLVSGAKSDKVQDCGFKVFYGKLANAPLIEQCPVSHACEVVHMLNLGSHEMVLGRIVETHVSDDCLTGGRVDVSKVRPFFFAGAYRCLGESVGEPFKAGAGINPAASREAVEEMKRMRG
jgi:flavin reductase (DIM6/NTAB) family NADH-FMN oxidoreductase RutF